MKMFDSMSCEEARKFYNQLKIEKERLDKEGKDTTILKQSLENLSFFTNNFTQSY